MLNTRDSHCWPTEGGRGTMNIIYSDPPHLSTQAAKLFEVVTSAVTKFLHWVVNTAK